uniref:Uncharacterized protein n=1 Tax=Anopheles maculatus TaxID=74869 RepID=A0A182T0N8_9DIPT
MEACDLYWGYRPGKYATTLHSLRNLSLSSIIDPGTSDDSGRASERLTTSSVAQRDPDSSRDRLSDASSRCSSGKGYICDSEGDDDKVSIPNARSVSLSTAATRRKRELLNA